MNVSVHFNNPSATFRRIFDKQTMTYAHTRLHALCSPYVPMNTGMLDQTVEINNEFVHYKVPYAHKVWDGEGLNFSRDKHPLATAHWDAAMKVAKGQQLADEITEYLKRR